MPDGVFILEVADNPAAKGRIVAVFSSEVRAFHSAERLHRELAGGFWELHWSRWISGCAYVEIPKFPVGGVIRPVVFRVTHYKTDQDTNEADAAALAIPAAFTI